MPSTFVFTYFNVLLYPLLIPQEAVDKNEEEMMLSSIDRYTKSGWFQKRAADKKAMDMIEALKIKCVGVSQPAKELSGGNQQKHFREGTPYGAVDLAL